MKELVLALAGFRSILSLLSILWFLYGIFVLISGRLPYPAPKQRGKIARFASLIIVIPFSLTITISYYIHEYFRKGPNSIDKLIYDNTLHIIVFFSFLIITFIACKTFAKAWSNENKKDSNIIQITDK